jgi:signal transduction histidine kinase
MEFFARATAGISHELKNVMATVSETAGLLGDLLESTQDVGSLDRSELLECGETIAAEVQRGFGIIKDLNRFAHSADRERAEVDLAELLELVARLARYSRKTCTIDVEEVRLDDRIIRTDPFQLAHLLYRAFLAVIDAFEPGGRVRASLAEDAPGLRISLAGGGSTRRSECAVESLAPLAGALGAEISRTEGGSGIGLGIPRD